MPRDVEEPDQSWYFEDWSGLPKAVKEAVFDIAIPMPKSAYTGMEIKRIELDANGWKPRIPQKQEGLMGAFGVFDTTDMNMVILDGQSAKWVMQAHKFAEATVGTEAARAAAGGRYINLAPHQIGLHVNWYNRPPEEGHGKPEDFSLKAIFGKDSKWLQERPGEAEFFTNAEAAVLGIYAYYPKKKKAMMKDFNLGTIESTSNPLLQGLVGRGYFRVGGREDFKEGEVARAVPIITAKGKAAAPYLPEGNFNTVFRREVIEGPREPFFSSNLGHWAGPTGVNVGIEVDEEGEEIEGKKFHIDPHPKDTDLR